MKCTICKTGHTHPGITTVTLQRDNTAVVIRDVPAEICEDCGESYLSEPIARVLPKAMLGQHPETYQAASMSASINGEITSTFSASG